MSVIYRCDAGCGTVIEADTYRIAVDVHDEIPQVEPDSDEIVQLRTLIGIEAEFHFCSSACLASWAMGRALEVHEATP